MLASPEETVYNILVKLVRDIGKGNSKVKDTLMKCLKTSARFLFNVGIGAAKAYGGRAVQSVAEGVPHSNVFQDEYDYAALSDLRETLENAISERLKSGDSTGPKGIIIFVDDLDRLNPPVAVEILELLKNVFTLKKCIFILAIDYEVVVKGLEPKFGKLTNKNEREFRSFFDKIIQVPFSLPVSKYDPMTFVMKSLKTIQYLSDEEEKDLKPFFKKIIETSVGNNPRALKRLINSLSLQRCIFKESKDENKRLNFIIVALQICYPRIYSLLMHKPDYKAWDYKFAIREGISIKAEEDVTDWEDVLYAACAADAYLSKRYHDIQDLFSALRELSDNERRAGATLENVLKNVAVTEVKASAGAEEFDRKVFMRKIQESVQRRINNPEITPKSNTGNGGFNFDVDGRRYGIKFVPVYNSKTDEVEMKMELSTKIPRSTQWIGKNLTDMLQEPELKAALNDFDSVIAPLLQNEVISSNASNGNDRFVSYMQQLESHHGRGHMSGDVTFDAEYIIKMKPSEATDEAKIGAIAEVIMANDEFRKAISGWK